MLNLANWIKRAHHANDGLPLQRNGAANKVGGGRGKLNPAFSRQTLGAEWPLLAEGVEELFSTVRDATMIQGRTHFRNKDSYARA
jgi:hypothetical protein